MNSGYLSTSYNTAGKAGMLRWSRTTRQAISYGATEFTVTETVVYDNGGGTLSSGPFTYRKLPS